MSWKISSHQQLRISTKLWRRWIICKKITQIMSNVYLQPSSRERRRPKKHRRPSMISNRKRWKPRGCGGTKSIWSANKKIKNSKKYKSSCDRKSPRFSRTRKAISSRRLKKWGISPRLSKLRQIGSTRLSRTKIRLSNKWTKRLGMKHKRLIHRLEAMSNRSKVWQLRKRDFSNKSMR